MPYRFLPGVAAFAVALAGAPPSMAATTPGDRMPTAAAVTRFYQARQAPLWLTSSEAVRTLLDALRTADVDGLQEGPELAGTIERVLADANMRVPGAAQEAERLMSTAFVLHAQQLKAPGKTGTIYADPALASLVPSPAAILEAAAAAPDLAAFVRGTVGINPIHAALRQAAVRDMRLLGTPPAALRASLDRARLLPSSGRFVLVDIASQQLMMIEDGKVVDSMKVVVGKPQMKTPLLAGTLRQVTFNPYWNVPVDLAASNIAQNVLKNGLGWFKSRNYEVLSGWGDEASAVDPASIDWQAVADGKQELRVRQRPGRGNSMGAMKFEFPNDLGIYLHDTPDRQLFAEPERTFSSGCVRLEDAARLGRWLLGREPVARSSEPEDQVALPAPVPVFLTYLTVRPTSDGGLVYAPDVYGLDTPAPEQLAAVR